MWACLNGAVGTLAELRRTVSPQVLRASVTPLASIFGSGFLIIVPLLERSMGRLAVIGVLAICALAWLVGGAIRHNIAVVEPKQESGKLARTDLRLERTRSRCSSPRSPIDRRPRGRKRLPWGRE